MLFRSLEGHFYIKRGNRFHIDELLGEAGAVLVVLLFTPCQRGFHIACKNALTWTISDTKIGWRGRVVRVRPPTVRQLEGLSLESKDPVYCLASQFKYGLVTLITAWRGVSGGLVPRDVKLVQGTM